MIEQEFQLPSRMDLLPFKIDGLRVWDASSDADAPVAESIGSTFTK
jgi:hypothetical protein